VHATQVLHAFFKRAAVLSCGLLLAAASLAADGRFEIRNAFVEPVAGIWQLNAIIELGLSRPAREALTEGIPLTLVLDIRVSGERRFLPNEDVAELQQRWKLAYDALSDRYVVTNLNSGAQSTFSTLDEALEALSRVRNLPLIDADLLTGGRRHEVSIRATVEIGGLPDAVKLLIFWRDWSRSTDWYTWSIRP
jgi:hypothetical protein